ncbi:MAG: hypothetical protein RDV41_03895 [Planctomycetota bacterium]|nr:hypothetical protein [Planctomycetota bacterium]
MKRVLLAVIALSCIVIVGCSSAKDVIGSMLKSKGLTRETARLDAQMLDTLAASQALMPPHFMRYWKNPWEFPKFVYSLTASQAEAVVKPEAIFDMYVISSVRTGRKVSALLQFAPSYAPKTQEPLIEALEMLYKRCGNPLTEEAREAVRKAAEGAPAEVRLLVAKFLFAAAESKHYRDRALRKYPREKWQAAFDYALHAFRSESDEAGQEFEDGDTVNWDLGQALDFDDLYMGAVVNVVALLDAQKFLADPVSAKKPPEGQEPKKIDISSAHVAFDTPLGKVVFDGRAENNVYAGGEHLVIIDLAGNDTYEGAAAASWKLEHPVSVVVDWSGDDKYIASEMDPSALDTKGLKADGKAPSAAPCAQGAGIMGYGFLIDNGGDDTFLALDNAQGAGYFGVGMLWCNGGNDKFRARHFAQGAAAFGFADLVKKGGEPVTAASTAATGTQTGNAPGAGTASPSESAAGAASYKADGKDEYYCWSEGQGFGYVGGYGCLLDTGGNDKYVAEPYKLFRPGVGGHDNLRNYNFCQGAGWGQRGDLGGGHSMAGGTGVLQDLAGDDTYVVGVYGQGTGYWYGTGILHDRSGNDRYEGSFFVQSGTAHMGLTMLLDEDGNDAYHVWHAISIAGAHDISVSWFIDKGGDDKLSAWEWKDAEKKQTLAATGTKDQGGGVLLGSAITNSVAVYLNLGGNDTYEFYVDSSFGWCQQRGTPGTWRYDLANIGLFADIGGEDSYVLKGNPVGWPEANNNRKWSRITPPGHPEKTVSLGLDAEKGTVLEAIR